MLVRHHFAKRVYVIEAPEGTRVHRSARAGESMLVVPWEGRGVPIFEVPGKMLVQLARSGSYGLRLIRVESAKVGGDNR